MHDDWLTLLDARVPRYTSYPTAPHFHAGIGAVRYSEWLTQAKLDQPISLYIHVPFCHQLCWYCGCNTSVTKSEEPVTQYVSALIADIERTCALLPARPRIGHMHFGGGSPNRLASGQFERIMTTLHAHFDFEPNAELAIEIDPRFIHDEQIQSYVKAGINRASIAMSDDDKLRGDIIEHLMCALSVDIEHIAKLHKADPAQFLPALEGAKPYLDHGMATLSGWQLNINPDWRVAARSIAALFDAYLDSGEKRHSAAV